MRVLLLSLAGFAGTATAQTKPKTPERVVEPRKWEHESSDLAPDPKFNFGTLKNGFRYVWVDHDNPKKAVWLRLHCNIGSLVEQDNERGMAHFVEHMAFNGTKNFKAGTLVDTFQREGIKFGHDVNAHTGQEETVYELDLPDAGPERLAKSFQWFRDVADGLLFQDKEVQSEKGVIDAEQRDRDDAGFRNFVDLLGVILDGTLYPKRLPIGVQEVRAKFDAKLCKAFYKRWYRPEHLTFVVVGDFGGSPPTDLIEKTFGTMPVWKEPLPARPDLGHPSFKNRFFTKPLFGGDSCQLTVAKVWERVPEPDNSKTRAAGIALSIAGDILEARLDALKEKPYTGATAAPYSFEEVVIGFAAQVSCGKERWRDALTVVEREIRRAVERGFEKPEFEKAYVAYNKAHLVARPMFPKPHALEYVNEVITACNRPYVPMEDKPAKAVLQAGWRGLTKEACHAALKEAWSKGELSISAVGGLDLGDTALEMFEGAWKESQASDLDKPLSITADPTAKSDTPKKEGEGTGTPDGTEASGATPDKDEKKKGDPKKWAYALPSGNAETAELKRLDDLKLTHVVFKNGVKANWKHLEGAGSGSIFEVRVGEGALTLDPAEADIAWVADNVFMECGLAKNPWLDVQAAMADGGAFVSFRVEGDALVFSGFGREFKRAFEVICAFLTDPGWRQEGFDDFKKNLDKRLESDEKPTLPNALQGFERAIYNGDKRFLPPDKAFVESLTLDDVKNFLIPQLDGPIEINVAGGVYNAEVERAVHATFGKLPPRRAAKASVDAHRTINPLKTGLKERKDVESGASSALLHIVYPCPDAIDIGMRRQLDLLGDIVGDRLRVEIREKRGGAYSPNAEAWGSDCYRQLGFVKLDVQVDPAKVDDMSKACTDAMEALGAKGITAPELDRIRKAAVGNVDAIEKDTQFWMDAQKRALKTPAVYDELRDLGKWYDKVTVEQLNALCKTVFAKGRGCVLVAVPRK